MTSKQKKLAAKILKCGTGRIWIDPTNKKVEQAITRSDIRGFIKEGIIKKLPGKKQLKNSEKRQQRSGSIKGSRGARIGKKNEWFKKIRPQREMIKELRNTEQIDADKYRKLYAMVKGGVFRSRAHLTMYLKDKKILKEAK
ncbi:MAG: 50S ribosomal protein L19e [Candidatus Aenigmarchaeota archaeon]|nr:50S ribosomal protein L19e [Candidatus Aenigmarchaeota archaeon]